MNTKLLIGAFFIGTVLTANAQSIVWSDNFNDENISDWSLIDADGDTMNWGDTFVVTDGPILITPVSLISRSWYEDVALTPDDWAITPPISLEYASGEILLTWIEQAGSEPFNEENYTVYVATSNDIAAFEASALKSDEVPGVNGEPATRSLDISSFAGQTIYVAFRHYNSTDMDFLSIDDVTVTAETLSTNNYLASQISIFPNPVNEVLNITNVENVQITGATITDLNGRIVKTAGFNGVSEAQINISNVASGIYILNIYSDKGLITRKIVKN